MSSKHRFLLLLSILAVVFMWNIVLNPTEMLYSEHSDTVGQYYYWKYFIQDSVQNHGQLPLWNPYTFGGQPFIGNFHSELFYPLFVFFYFMPIHMLFGWLFLLHLILAGIAMFFLLKEFKLENFSSFIGSVLYIFSGYTITHIYAGHVSFMPTLLCVPLIFLFFEKAVNNKSYLHASLTALFIAIQFLGAHPQFFFYTIFILSAYFLFRLFTSEQKAAITKLFITMGILSLLLASIQLLPSFELTQHSSREGGLDKELATKLSMPPWEIVSFISPEFFGNPVEGNYWGRWNIWEINGYIGVAALLLALFSIFYVRSKKTLFFSGTALFSLLFAMGKYTPIYWLFYYVIPGFSMFRGPSKMLFFYMFSAVILAAVGTNYIINNKPQSMKKVTITLIVISSIIFVLTLASYLFKDQLINLGQNIMNTLYIKYQHTATVQALGLEYLLNQVTIIFDQVIKSSTTLIVMLALTVILLFLKLKDSKYFRLALVVLIVWELAMFGMQFIDTKPVEEVYDLPNYASKITGDMEIIRVLDLTGELDQSKAVQKNIMLVGGYDPLITGDYYKFAARISDAPATASETLPIDEIKNKEILDLLNVKYVISDSSLSGFNQISGKLYKNEDYLPRAHIEGEAQEIVEYTPNKITVKTSKAGTLILSENYFPGWKAYIDGEEVKIYKVNDIQRAVDITAPATVVFEYKPLTYCIGKILTLLGLILLIGMIIWQTKR